jgi:hypothetical protein
VPQKKKKKKQCQAWEAQALSSIPSTEKKKRMSILNKFYEAKPDTLEEKDYRSIFFIKYRYKILNKIVSKLTNK